MNYNTDLMTFSYNCSVDYKDDVITNLQHSNQICLPNTVLNKISDQEFPVFFQLTNQKNGKACICGVYEFTSPPGVCYIPYRLMQTLWITEGETINICLYKPEKGKYIKLKPHTSDFIKLSNPKIILEKMLSRYYPIVSKNDTISILYNKNVYYIDIIESQPSDTIQIINTDLNVDFDEPMDYQRLKKEEEIRQSEKIKKSDDEVIENIIENTSNLKKNDVSKYKKNNGFIAFQGVGNRLGSE